MKKIQSMSEFIRELEQVDVEEVLEDFERQQREELHRVGLTITLNAPLVEGYLRDQDGQFWKIEKVRHDIEPLEYD